MGPGGLGSIAAEITENFVASPVDHEERADPARAGPVLDHAGDQHRGPSDRRTIERELTVTQTLETPSHRRAAGGAARRIGRGASVRFPRSTVIEMGGSALAAVALVWLCFTVAGISGPLGFAICVVAAFLSSTGSSAGACTACWP